jgi:hypothetical protein
MTTQTGTIKYVNDVKTTASSNGRAAVMTFFFTSASFQPLLLLRLVCAYVTTQRSARGAGSRKQWGEGAGLNSRPAGARIDIHQAPRVDSALTILLRVHLGRSNEISTSPSARFRSSLVCHFGTGDGLAIRRSPSHNAVKGWCWCARQSRGQIMPHLDLEYARSRPAGGWLRMISLPRYLSLGKGRAQRRRPKRTPPQRDGAKGTALRRKDAAPS